MSISAWPIVVYLDAGGQCDTLMAEVLWRKDTIPIMNFSYIFINFDVNALYFTCYSVKLSTVYEASTLTMSQFN